MYINIYIATRILLKLTDIKKVHKTAKRKEKLLSIKLEKDGKACRVNGTMQVHHTRGDSHVTAEGVRYATLTPSFLSAPRSLKTRK